jgi:hypothetical protein
VLRFVPVSTAALRNPADTGNVVEWGADVLGFFNVAPVARQLVPLGSTPDQIINALNNLGLFRLV